MQLYGMGVVLTNEGIHTPEASHGNLVVADGIDTLLGEALEGPDCMEMHLRLLIR